MVSMVSSHETRERGRQRLARLRGRIPVIVTAFLVAAHAASVSSQVPQTVPEPKPKLAGMMSLYLLRNNAFNATCLDGSPPGYYLSRGWGSGVNNWVIYLPGGAWCASLKDCAVRARTPLGSTNMWPDPAQGNFTAKLAAVDKRSAFFKGIMSDSPNQNPAFYNYNKVFVFYCDGGAFAGDRTGVPYNATFSMNFHGKRNLDAVMYDLQGFHGLRRAEKVLFTGCSAGGQAISMHCDSLAAKFPPTAKVKCLMDAGFFMDVADMNGQLTFRRQAANMIVLHNMWKGFDADCKRALPPRLLFKCFFPQYNLLYITKPMFVVNSIVDYAAIYILNQADGSKASTQLAGNMVRCISGGELKIYASKADIPPQGTPTCSSQQLIYLDTYQRQVMRTVNSVIGRKPGFGSFLFSTVEHCTVIYNDWIDKKRKAFQLVPSVTNWFLN